MKKYELDKSTKITLNRLPHYRIKALKDFADVKAGDLGGYIQSEANLSQDGNCWVYDDAIVSGNARVVDNAVIKDKATVDHNAIVKNNAIVKDFATIKLNATVAGNATVSDHAVVSYDALCDMYANVSDNAHIWHNAHVSGHARISGKALILDKATIKDHATITDNASVANNAIVCGQALVKDKAMVLHYSVIGDDATVLNDSVITSMAEIVGDAVIAKNTDYEVFKNNWSSGRSFTYTKSNHMWCVGCFYGTGQELIEKAYADSERSGQNYERYVKFAEQKQPIHKKKIIITEDDKRKLADILDDDETKYFLKDIASYETECTLNEDLLNFTHMASKQHQIETYKSLKTDRERYIYATAIGQEYALDILCSHITDVLNAYDLECLNSFFKTVELVID